MSNSGTSASLEERPNIVIRIVRPKLFKENAILTLENIYNTLCELNHTITWITEEECMQIEKHVKHVFIFYDFYGEAFEHLRYLNCRIYGPPVLLFCINNCVPLPKNRIHYFCRVMENVTVSCTNVERSVRDKLHDMILWMGGSVSRSMTSKCDFLIAAEVGSLKYRAACGKVPILTPEWVKMAWKNRYKEKFVAADPAFIENYKCLAFTGLTITVSGFVASERAKLRELIEKNGNIRVTYYVQVEILFRLGGIFSGIMKQNETSHLVTNTTKSEKYKIAKLWTDNVIKIVTVDWIHKSCLAGHCLQEEDFEVQDPTKSRKKKMVCSTPNSSFSKRRLVFLEPNCSSIRGASMNSVLTSDMIDKESSSADPSQVEETKICRVTPAASQRSIMSTIDGNSSDLFENSITETSSCLEGCKVWLYGFSSDLTSKLEKYVDFCGGVLASIDSEITHAVIGDVIDVNTVANLLKGRDLRGCFVVRGPWLLHCFKSGRKLDESEFVHQIYADLLEQLESGMVGSKIEQNQEEEVVVVENVEAPVADPFVEKNFEEKTAIENIMLTYLVDDVGEAPFVENEVDFPNEETTISDTLITPTATSSSSCVEITSVNDQADGNQPLLAGKSFFLAGFDADKEEELSECIKLFGGTLVSKFADFAVLPWVSSVAFLPWANRADSVPTETVWVSDYWIKACISEKKLLSLRDDILFRPIFLPDTAKPLSDCVICFSGFSSTERDVLALGGTRAGAKIQNYMCRQAKPDKKFLATTHLIVKIAEGNKYEAAKKWNIPCMTLQWLSDCIRTRVKIEESIYQPNQHSFDQQSTSEPKAKDVMGSDSDLKPIQTEDEDNPPKVASSKRDLSQLETVWDGSYSFLNKTAYRAKFDFVDSFQSEKTLSSSLETDVLFEQNLGKAARFTSTVEGGTDEERPDFNFSVSMESSMLSNVAEGSTEGQRSYKPLSGVVIVVSSDLLHLQMELHQLVIQLGGFYCWHFDPSCTHFICQGTNVEKTREGYKAIEAGCALVHPRWLYQCKIRGCRVSESGYPPTYTSDLHLPIMAPTPGPLRTKNKRCFQKWPLRTADGSDNEEPTFVLQKRCRASDPAEDDLRASLKRHLRSVLDQKPAVEEYFDQSFNNPSAQGSSVFEAPVSKEPELEEESVIAPVDWDDPNQRIARERIGSLLKPQNEPTQQSTFDSSQPVNQNFLFQFTSLNSQQKQIVLSAFSELKVAYTLNSDFYPSCTHVIAGTLGRTEKALCALATGKWILTFAYVEACRQHGFLVEEQEYEWAKFLRDSGDDVDVGMLDVAEAAVRWRKKIQREHRYAFDGWMAFIAADSAKQKSLERLICFGGGKVFTKVEDAPKGCFAFVDVNSLNFTKDFYGKLIQQGLKCFKVEYISGYLLNEPFEEDLYIIDETLWS
ncbi:DNA topoisomerase 2-binding protein 1 [Trichinella nelsoni]|uniref:DNA topoisomerase 2-binding protein 1 n=1 Tax=Trichinella nelsoni TaxID=6336 RepID=A0A0V0SMW7_9BILA|nr:DNA topoisomerase 2-binding protein 1 [Trichinella nelsoni]